MFKRIAIIGGGAAAAALVSELLERPGASPLHVDWYTGGASRARGVAYGTDDDRHLLNVRAASMSMFAGKPSGFLDFAQSLDPSIQGTDFLPRRVYGDYLETEVARALAGTEAQGHDVQIMPFAVDALVPETDGVDVIVGETSRRADVAVLAIGSLPPQPLGGVSKAALASGRYVVDPWPFLRDCVADTQPRNVLLIGLGLTATDVLISLSARWPTARFTTLSRHALFPEPHLAHASAPTDDGADLIEQMRDAPEVLAWFRLLREATSHAEDWRTVVDSLRPHTQALWRELPPREKARFLRHARWAWERVRHRMPAQVNQSMRHLEQSGRLRRERGRLRGVDQVGEQLQVRLERADTGLVETRPFDLVIQTVGLNTDARQPKHPLMRQLVTNGHVLPDALGMGLQAAPDGQLCHAKGTWRSLYAIGSLLRGSVWETTAMPEIRMQARHVADQLVDIES